MAGDGLPFILREVRDIAGLDAALQLARARGGRRLYVPARPSPEFSREIGAPAAEALCQLYPGENVHIPLGPTGTIHQARRAAEQAISQGLSTSEAAARSGLTERAIWGRKAKRRQQLLEGQADLFGKSSR